MIRIFRIAALLLILLVMPFAGYLVWLIKPVKPLDILVVNKSVTSRSRTEHKAAFWLLNSGRFVKSSGRTYDHKNDYFGFFPLKPYNLRNYEIKSIRLSEVDSLANSYDMAWYIDTYGMTVAQWYGSDDARTYSRMLHGGLNQNDFLFISNMLEQEKLVIAEFNFFGSPTSDLVRRKTEELTGIYWSGWTGTYFQSLDYTTNADVPQLIVDYYNDQNTTEWMYTRPGIVLVSHDNRVIVLEHETHLDIEVPLITTSDRNASLYDLPGVVHFPSRFDISYSTDTSKIISYFEIFVNERGSRLLAEKNIPERFPAVTLTGDGRFLYMSGSFSDHRVPLFTSRLAGGGLARYIMSNKRVGSKSSFFNEYYVPLLKCVMENYYDELQGS